MDAKLTSEQFSQLLALLDKHNNTTSIPNENGSSTSAHFAGKFCLASHNHDTWIIDSRASDHIHFDTNLFSYHKPLIRKNHFITVPDGRRVIVTYKGIVKLSTGLVLKVVLFVSDFNFNLLSVHKLVLDMKCRAIFTNDQCLMQESLMRKPLPLGKASNGLYYVQRNMIIQHPANNSNEQTGSGNIFCAQDEQKNQKPSIVQ